MKQAWRIFWLLALAAASCAREPAGTGPRYGPMPRVGSSPCYIFAVHPLYNPNKLMQAYQPLIDYLNARTVGARFTLEASRDYASFEEKYRHRGPALLLPNPWQTLQAISAGYHVIAMAGDPGDFRGVFIVRKDSGIHAPTDLKGKVVSYPSPTALAACIMPQYFLHQAGISILHDLENRYVGSQESSIMNVYLGQTQAGATWPPPWRAFQKDHPREAAMLRVIWQTSSLINNSVMVRDDIPLAVQKQIKELLFALPQTEAGRSILENMETTRFLPAMDRDYDVVRDYITRFEKEVRPVEQR